MIRNEELDFGTKVINKRVRLGVRGGGARTRGCDGGPASCGARPDWPAGQFAGRRRHGTRLTQIMMPEVDGTAR